MKQIATKCGQFQDQYIEGAKGGCIDLHVGSKVCTCPYLASVIYRYVGKFIHTRCALRMLPFVRQKGKKDSTSF